MSNARKQAAAEQPEESTHERPPTEEERLAAKEKGSSESREEKGTDEGSRESADDLHRHGIAEPMDVVPAHIETATDSQGIERIVSTVPASGWEPAPTEAPAHEVAALERMQEKLGLAQERREERRSERKTEASRG